MSFSPLAHCCDCCALAVLAIVVAVATAVCSLCAVCSPCARCVPALRSLCSRLCAPLCARCVFLRYFSLPHGDNISRILTNMLTSLSHVWRGRGRPESAPATTSVEEARSPCHGRVASVLGPGGGSHASFWGCWSWWKCCPGRKPLQMGRFRLLLILHYTPAAPTPIASTRDATTLRASNSILIANPTMTGSGIPFA